MKVKLVQVLIVIFWSLAANAASDIYTPNISTISERAEEAVLKKIDAPENAKVEIIPQRLDSRLNIPRCSSPIIAELASNRSISKTNTVKISCISPDLDYPWQIFLSVRVNIRFPVVVAKETLASGELISANQLVIGYVDQTSIRGQQFNDISSVVGTRVKRRVTKNHPIFAKNLCYVCKGDNISIYARTDKFVIKTLGEALRDGNLGDTIRVRNTSSNKTIDARVVGIGEVEIRM